MDWESFISLAVNNGIWAALFVGLMIYILKDGDKREKKYQQIIEKLARNLEKVNEIADTTKDLKKDITEIKFKMPKR